MNDTNLVNNPVIVIDFGAQYAQLIARRVREAGFYSEVVSHQEPIEKITQRKPQAIILSGGPASVYAENSPDCAKEIFTLGIPIFGICYGFQLMSKHLGGGVKHTGISEYGRTELTEKSGVLHENTGDLTKVWMSHTDQVVASPVGFQVNAQTKQVNIAGFENLTTKMAGVQYHPEVVHSEFGQQVIKNFLFKIANLQPNWNTVSIEKDLLAQIKAQVGDKKVICGLSGGVDSAVAAALVQKAIGANLTCIFVDHGLLRAGEREQVEKDFVSATGVKLVTVDARKEFLTKLSGVTDPETKRKIIGELFIRTFEKAVADLLKTASVGETIDFLVQGTLYPDMVESGGGSGTANIKSHHNVGGLPEDIQFKLVEPLRWLFKDEVRALGKQLGLPNEIVDRQPFPGPGLAIRIVGEVNETNLDILRKADAIVREEFTAAGLDKQVWQCPVVLLAGVRSVGVQGDGRTYGHPIVLRPVSSEDAMTADWVRVPYEVLETVSTRITNEVTEVNRVVLDVTSKPPGTIEWE